MQTVVGSDVRPGEGRLVLVFFANLLLLLTAYYILKVVREPLILLNGGAVSRSYARGLEAGLLMVLVPAYSFLANRIEPGRLVNGVNGFFVASLFAFAAIGPTDLPLGFAFFVWLGIFSTMAITQFWSLANDVMTKAEGRRLFPLVAAGGTLGGIFGSQIAARGLGPFDVHELMGIAAAILVACMALTHYGRKTALAYRALHRRNTPELARDGRGGFTLLLKDRYLLLIGAAVLLLNLVNTTGEYILADMVSARAAAITNGAPQAEQARMAYVGAFYGDFQTAVSVMTAAIQILLVGRVFRFFGVGRSLWILPLLVIGGYSVSALLPVLALVAAVKIAENGTAYSLQSTLQQALFLSASRDAKYKAKTAIDTFFVRAGDLASAWLVYVGVHAQLGARGFAWANVALGVLSLFVVVRIVRRRRAYAPKGENLARIATAAGLRARGVAPSGSPAGE